MNEYSSPAIEAPDEGWLEDIKVDRAALGTVYFTVFLDLLGFGIILPWLPYYAARLGATGLLLGLLFTAYSLAQLFGAAILGRMSDRHGRRPILMISLMGSAVGMVLSGLTDLGYPATLGPGEQTEDAAWRLAALIFARAVAGLFGGSIAVAQAYVADVTSPSERPKYMGFVGASIGMGFVVGPALGALVKSMGYGFMTVAFLSAGLALVNLGLAAWRLKEPRRRSGAKVKRLASLGAWQTAFGRPTVRRALLATFFTMAAFVSMETTFAYLGRDRFGLDTLSFGLVLAFVGVVLIIIQGGVIWPLSRRLGSRRVARLGCVLMAVALAVLPLAPSLVLAVAALGCLAAGQGLTSPSLASIMSNLASDDDQGSVLGVSQSLSAGARAFAPVLAGGLYDFEIAAPYFVGALLALMAAFLISGVDDP